MNFWPLIITALGVAIGVISIIQNPDKSSNSRIIKIGIGLICLLGILNYLSAMKKQEKSEELLRIELEDRASLQRSLESALKQLGNAAMERDKLLNLLGNVDSTVKDSNVFLYKYFSDKGASTTNLQKVYQLNLDASLAADNQLFEYSKLSYPLKSRIWYFKKPGDVGFNLSKIIPILEERGFKVEEKKAQLRNLETNALFYGNSVPDQNVKFVALLLIRAGVEIVWFGKTNNDGLIQIGSIGEEPLLNYRPWSVDEIVNSKNLKKIGNPQH